MNDDEQERVKRAAHWRQLAELLGLPPGSEPPPVAAPTATPAARMEKPDQPEPPQPAPTYARVMPEERHEEVLAVAAEEEADLPQTEFHDLESGSPAETEDEERPAPSGQEDDDSQRRGGRRRSRRGRKGPSRREAPLAEAVTAPLVDARPKEQSAEPTHEAEAEEAVAEQQPAMKESGEEEPARRGRGRGRSRPRDRKGHEPAPAPVIERQEVEEEPDRVEGPEDATNEEPDTLSDWNVPSWNELIASLYRPPER